MRTIVDRLFSVKSIVTLLLTGAFVYLSVTGVVSGEQFMTVFTVVISFYFGTQVDKRLSKEDEGGTKNDKLESDRGPET